MNKVFDLFKFNRLNWNKIFHFSLKKQKKQKFCPKTINLMSIIVHWSCGRGIRSINPPTLEHILDTTCDCLLCHMSNRLHDFRHEPNA